MVFTIDGLDIVPFIAEDGVDWTPNGVDGPDAGRAMNAKMYRGLITHKARADVSCLWLKKEDVVLLYNKLMKEYFTVVTDTVPWIKSRWRCIPTTQKSNFPQNTRTAHSFSQTCNFR